MKHKPEHRFELVRQALADKKAPESGLERNLYDLLVGEEEDAIVSKALDINQHDYKREVMESFLLSGASEKEIEEVLGIIEDVTKAYRHLFFDDTVFEDRLDRIEYANAYTKSDYGAKMKKMAVDYGKDALKIRMSSATSYVSPHKVQNEIRAVAYMLAQRAKTNPVDSYVAREALHWAKLALKAAESVEEEVTSGMEEMSIALDAKDESTNSEKSGLSPDEILH